MSAKSLITAMENRLPIKVVQGDDERLVSHIYVTRDEGRLVWGEPGFMLNADTFGVHLAEGPVRGDGPWRVGDYLFVEMDEDDDLQYDHTAMILMEKERGDDYEQAVRALAQAF